MVEDWVMKLPLNLIYCVASDYKLDARLVAAICQVESGGNFYKTRFEAVMSHDGASNTWTYRSGYKYLVDPSKFARRLNVGVETETAHQQTSWGLMQIMGGTARWLGYEDDLPQLCQPRVNLYWSCMYLKQLYDKWPDDKEHYVAAYNGGPGVAKVNGEWSNQKSYVDKVMMNYLQLTS